MLSTQGRLSVFCIGLDPLPPPGFGVEPPQWRAELADQVAPAGGVPHANFSPGVLMSRP